MSEKDAVIKPIDKKVVNQICSGQVVLNLATAMKELLENSLDAHATSIQINFKEYGTEMVEVTDNGHGVEEQNFQALTLKHYTSKISNFSDVSTVETYGFRGEALSSLCSLSNVSIVTKHKDSPSGTKLKFDNNGIIVSSTKIARQTGTTVALENIFHTLPVRHKEFIRNIKKEFLKMCNVLYAYGLLSKGISITCKNQVSNKKVTIMETKGETLKSNISQIFGAKQSQNLLELKECAPEDVILDDSDADQNLIKNTLHGISLEGYVSSCAHGCGRSSSDRQFYYINSRPVDNTKVMKIVNDVYHQYNPHQYPFIVLNMQIDMKCIDVNVTPDKRSIFLRNESFLLGIIKASLHKVFQNIPATINYQNIGLTASIGGSPSPACKEGENNGGTPLDKLQRFRLNSYSEEKGNGSKGTSCYKERGKSQALFTQYSVSKAKLPHKMTKSDVNTEKFEENVIGQSIPGNKDGGNVILADPACDPGDCKSTNRPLTENRTLCKVENPETVCEPEGKHIPSPGVNNDDKSSGSNKRKELDGNECDIPSESDCSESKPDAAKRIRIDDGMSATFKGNRKSVTLPLNLNYVRQRAFLCKAKNLNSTQSPPEKIRFYSEISPQQNENAESELQRELEKGSFKKMNIIGQFNLGFIIVNLGSDVFIVDQHATDEKYNFETLQLTTKLLPQKLVIPQNLNLTVEKEELFLHHSDVIRMNGFDFIFDDAESPTNRIKLTSVPLSKNWIFGKEDIEELLFMLESAPDGIMCRPSRIRDMFASRACRKSVMIGTPLNHFEMRRLIDHMGEIEQPWNCPHGRPTIRHLINLNLVKVS